ncbi:RDD family protein [Thorsellia kenyensis]|uniref:RDD family protein n=1 Tax=Thorsellia kenyensis TaxID=1549888 RepID=A0ABV6CAV1_9GAMM
MQEMIHSHVGAEYIRASRSRRLLANIIDLIFSLLIGVPLTYAIFAVFKTAIIGGDIFYDDIYEFIFLFIIGPVLSMGFICPIYELLITLRQNKNTLGKRLTKIRIINHQEEKGSTCLLILRVALKAIYYMFAVMSVACFLVVHHSLGQILLVPTILLLVFVFLGTKDHQGLHNRLTRTSIVLSGSKAR